MIRQRVSFVVAGAIVASSAMTVGLASSASAADTQYDPNFVPAAGDLVGVGSDTIEIALDYLSKGITGTPGFNNTGSPSFKVASFAAAGTPADVTLRSTSTGSIPRSTINGSGSGKSKLYGTGNNTDVSFARSSSSLNQNEITAGLQQFPFAVDGLKLAVSNGVTTHAPATISPADLVKIYSGQVTNWSQLGGTSGTIKPYVPPTTSGTYSFFIAQLKAANSGTDVTLTGSVGTSQEHDDALIKNDPDAVAPFSTARAKSLTSTIKLEKGFKAYRAVYNVVRQADTDTNTATGQKINTVFGPDGFVCSPAAKPLIEAAGFDQLASSGGAGGVCGVATQAATSNLKTTGQIDTETTLTAAAINDNKVKLTAKVDASSAPVGAVQFRQGSTALGDPVEVDSNGVATKTLTLVGNGSYEYKAEFTPDSIGAFTSSSDTKTLSVKASSQVTIGLLNPTGTYGTTRLAAFSATVDGEAATGTVNISIDGGADIPLTLSGGAAFYTVPGTSDVGSHTIKATLPAGESSNADSSSASFTVTKATTKASFKFADSTIKASTTPKATVTVVINGASSSVKPSGKVTLKYGSKTVGTGTVTNGTAKVNLKKQKKKSSAYGITATFTSTNDNYSSSPASAKVNLKVS